MYKNLISIILSILVSLFYITLAILSNNLKIVFSILLFITLPLSCIWFGKYLGKYKGWTRFHKIDQETPGCFIKFIGWILLLTPFIAFLIYKCTQY